MQAIRLNTLYRVTSGNPVSREMLFNVNRVQGVFMHGAYTVVKYNPTANDNDESWGVSETKSVISALLAGSPYTPVSLPNITVLSRNRMTYPTGTTMTFNSDSLVYAYTNPEASSQTVMVYYEKSKITTDRYVLDITLNALELMLNTAGGVTLKAKGTFVNADLTNVTVEDGSVKRCLTVTHNMNSTNVIINIGDNNKNDIIVTQTTGSTANVVVVPIVDAGLTITGTWTYNIYN